MRLRLIWAEQPLRWWDSCFGTIRFIQNLGNWKKIFDGLNILNEDKNVICLFFMCFLTNFKVFVFILRDVNLYTNIYACYALHTLMHRETVPLSAIWKLNIFWAPCGYMLRANVLDKNNTWNVFIYIETDNASLRNKLYCNRWVQKSLPMLIACSLF